jgi:hypothetical protein
MISIVRLFFFLNYSLLALFLFSSCSRYYLSVYQESVHRESLASVYAGTPDPEQLHPPSGQKLIVEWQVPKAYLIENPLVQLNVLFWNNTEEHYVWPINQRRGYEILELLDNENAKREKILAYRARVLNEEGQVFREWRHMLWVQLIQLPH